MINYCKGFCDSVWHLQHYGYQNPICPETQKCIKHCTEKYTWPLYFSILQ